MSFPLLAAASAGPVAAPGGGEGMPTWAQVPAGTLVEVPLVTSVGAAVRGDGNYNTCVSPNCGTDSDNVFNYSGAALIEVDGKPYLAIYGGGHNDSAYNGVIIIGPLYGAGSDTPTASVYLPASDPSDIITTAIGPEPGYLDPPHYLDGRVTSTHSYGELIGVNDRLYLIGLSSMFNDHPAPHCYYFTAAGQTPITDFPAAGLQGSTAYYDGKIYHIKGNDVSNKLHAYTVATDTWEAEPGATISVGDQALAVDTSRGLLFLSNGYGSYTYDPTTLVRSSAGSILPPAGDGPIGTLAYDSINDQYLIWISGPDKKLYAVDAAEVAAGTADEWEELNFTGDEPSVAYPQGTYGRFRYLEQLKGAIVASDLEGPIFFYKTSN